MLVVVAPTELLLTLTSRCRERNGREKRNNEEEGWWTNRCFYSKRCASAFLKMPPYVCLVITRPSQPFSSLLLLLRSSHLFRTFSLSFCFSRRIVRAELYLRRWIAAYATLVTAVYGDGSRAGIVATWKRGTRKRVNAVNHASVMRIFFFIPFLFLPDNGGNERRSAA